MENKINVATILKDKPQGTKLYNWLYNTNVELDSISTTDKDTAIWCTKQKDINTTTHFCFSKLGTMRGCLDGLQILLPSKEMRDWRKFSWEKGDVLVHKDGDVHIIFERFVDDTYCSFVGKYYLWKENNDTELFYKNERLLTSDFQKAGKDAAKTYINTIEERLGGKLNRETLEVEKPQPEFKDGDIVCMMDRFDNYRFIFIYRNEDDENFYYHAHITRNGFVNLGENEYLSKPRNYSVHFATDLEKQQLFDALAKKGKAWDAGKKMIIDLKPKVELKPFDKVVVRCSEADRWSIDFFSYKAPNGYICTGDAWFGYCLPYNEETAKLIGTTKNMEV